MTPREMYNQALGELAAGNFEEAERGCREMLVSNARDADAINLLGVIAHQRGRHEVAVELIGQAMGIAPRAAGYCYNLGLVLDELQRFGDAAAAYARAVEIDPGQAAYQRHLGVALQRMGRAAEAAAVYRRALALEPGDFLVLYNLGCALADLGDMNGAIVCFRQALMVKGDLPQAYNRLAQSLCVMGRVDEAVAVCRRGMEVLPGNADVHSNLGQSLMARGELEAGIAATERGMELAPDNADIAGNRQFALHFHPRFDSAAILRERREWNDRYARGLAGQVRPHENDRTAGRRLRIGFVSPDFFDHCQALFTVPLLRELDREEFEVFLYSSVARADAVTARLRGLADHWREAGGVGDEQLAAQVREDRIDVLVDLTMHMAGNRLLMFGRKPSPVQVTWLAYPGTTGLGGMDYRLTDPYLDPPGVGDEFYSERSIRLRDTFWCSDAGAVDSGPALEVGALPAEANGYVTFGCLNNFCKVSDGTLELWRRVMEGVAKSRLRLLAPAGEAVERVMRILPRDRVDIVARQPRRAYLGEFGKIDICLDTIPYNSHTTGLDSFWMGVPMVTRVGATVVGRAGLSQLTNLGLTELIGYDDERFVQIAAELAGDLSRVAELRRTLRERMAGSPLMDARRFARSFEGACRGMWGGYCSLR